MEGFFCFAFVAGVVGVIVWQFIETQRAVATTTVASARPPAEAAQIVRGAFGGPRAVLWTTAAGPGTINMRRRGVRGGITMSITVEPRRGGGSEVAMWASETVVYLGFLVNFAGVVNRRKAAIGRLLTADPADR
ncbi:hypothetical protein [Micromonospora sp. WMMD714]|uniref:hypothetical protein n=1 Tax=Micromonospora sp. WMMD714 TaxID=3016097 RepID=UPI00249A4875|nr:hypothetical protein [Micromonospora sp. WMMD714]WFE66511.1 hypothetical protein O7625_25845 [Micromonospora sp. WMMD714]